MRTNPRVGLAAMDLELEKNLAANHPILPLTK